MRGKFVRKRLFCQKIPPPPPSVNADQDPKSADGSPCKVKRYEAHASNGACASCHKAIDPSGFGLEAFDGAGKLRTHDEGLAECPVVAKGSVVTAGASTPFSGPGALGRILVESGAAANCFTVMMVDFLDGADPSTSGIDVAAAQAVFKKNGYRLKDFLIEVLTSMSTLKLEDKP